MIDELYIDDLQIHGDGANYQITGVGPGFFGSAVPRANRPERGQRDGLIELSYFYGGRVIDLNGIAVGTSPGDALDKIDALKLALRLNTGQTNDFEQLGVNQGASMHKLTRKLVARDYSEYCFFTQDAAFDAPMDIVSKIIPWSVTIVASDPRWYQIHVPHDEDIYGADGVVSNYLYVDLYDGDPPRSVTAGGNTAALPWITSQGPFNTFMLLEMDDGVNPVQTDQLDLTLADGNNVDIVTRTRLAIKNQTIRHDIVNRENTKWFELPPTTPVDLTYTTGGGTDAGSVCRVKWQIARL